MERQSVYICLLCQDKIVRQRISLKELQAVKRASSTASNVTTKTPKKKAKKDNCPSGAILRNLRKLAAFHCYVFMFEAYEKKKMTYKIKIMEESFYGDPRKKLRELSISSLMGTMRSPRCMMSPSSMRKVSLSGH